MKLHDQVISVEQAARLKELGVSQSAYFSWFLVTDRDDTPGLNRATGGCPVCGHPTAPYIQEVSAFSVAELGQMLDSETITERKGTELSKYANWEWCYENHSAAFGPYATEAEARAAMLIYCIEKGITSVGQINKRLNV